MDNTGMLSVKGFKKVLDEFASKYIEIPICYTQSAPIFSWETLQNKRLWSLLTLSE